MKPDPNAPDSDADAALDALFAAARAAQPATARAEYGFETRLLARIAAGQRQPGFFWRLPLSLRLSPVFAAIALLTIIWCSVAPTDPLESVAPATATVSAGISSSGDAIDNWLFSEWFADV